MLPIHLLPFDHIDSVVVLLFVLATCALLIRPTRPNNEPVHLEKSTSALKPTPYKAGGRFRVMTYNVLCIPEWLGNNTYPRERMLLLSKKLLELPQNEIPDVLCLQEMFDPTCVEALTPALSQLYGYLLYPAGKHWMPIFGQNSGLLIASRYRIVDAAFMPFSNHIGSDYWAAKGALCASIDLGCGRSVVIMNTHGQADPDTELLWKFTLDGQTRCKRVRKENYARAASFVEAFAQKHGASSSVYCGDFNIPGEDDEYNSLLSSLGRPVDVYRKCCPKKKGFTYSHKCNVWAVEEGDGRLDFVFAKNAEAVAAGVLKMRVEDSDAPDTWRKRKEEAPQGAELSLSDHYPVLVDVSVI